MMIARFGLFRFLFLMAGIILLQGSPTIPAVFRRPLSEIDQEHRVYRKSRLASLVIPRKSALWVENTQGWVDIQDYLKEPIPSLAMFNSPKVRDLVIDFFVDLTRNEEIALTTLYYADYFQISPILAFSLAYHESRFNPMAVNRNATSIDRGVFQLNNLSFPRLNEQDFFDIRVNIRHGMMHLNWCLSVTETVEQALGVYNAGLSRIMRGEYPAITQIYIRRIMNFQETLERELIEYVATRIPQTVARL
jgi:soluble lytic murein transglycosylase-like protein